jgi:hypothetical protein
VITKSVGEKILQEITQDYKLQSTEEAMSVIAIFAQQGGTTKKCDGNMQISLFGTIIKLAGIRKIFYRNGLKNGLRKFAKTYAMNILEIAQILDLNGNLASKIQRLNPERTFTKKELIYLSEFQVNNSSVPQELRQLIAESFKDNQKLPKRK